MTEVALASGFGSVRRFNEIFRDLFGRPPGALRRKGGIDLEGKHGSVAVAHLPQRNSVLVTIRFPSVRALPSIVARVRRVFDLGADITTIGSHLARDPKLAPLIRKRPGLRAPGDWERETMIIAAQNNVPPAWRPWHAYAAQHLRMATHG
jgi:AraC family transcriptional regulator of adaptative response / DNA-3-methyladenine glycosylase II